MQSIFMPFFSGVQYNNNSKAKTMILVWLRINDYEKVGKH